MLGKPQTNDKLHKDGPSPKADGNKSVKKLLDFYGTQSLLLNLLEPS
jgi:hypothetical protein